MESASFTVETSKWKTLYKMKYTGDDEKLMAFMSLVRGTIQTRIGDLFPALKEGVKGVEFSGDLNDLSKISKRIVKQAGVSKDYVQFAIMWVSAELLIQAGVKIFPEKKDLRKILKRI